ncbi:unnamed protein product [Clonostachys solani]|uniref:Transcription factor domain-containing protein n=1 Tax=Clonostachys solani TaxID=160281 RepID=A0A9N9ZIQ6_9HYPO|nr:unnamed protein product [Clonostachys solani]
METEDSKQHYFRWRDREMQVRLVYTWIILDLELSLFHDVKTVLSLTDFKLPVPISEELFLSKELAVGEFSLEQPPDIDIANDANRPSLQTMLQWLFKQGFDSTRRKHLNPTTLHVLLHAILSMIRNYRQLFGYMGQDARIRLSVFSPFSKASTKTRMDEMRGLLQYWLGLFNALWPSSTRLGDGDPCLPSPQLYGVLITYHFICLETVIDMPAIENLARQRRPDSTIAQMDTALKDQYIQDLVPVLFHSGQILYLLRVLEQTSLPPWWPAAIYRVTMVLWATSVLFGSAWKQPSGVELLSPIIIDASLHDDDSNLSPLWQENSESYSVGGEGAGLNMPQSHTPALSVRGDLSNATLLSDPQRVLETCLLAFEKGRSIRFADGIYRKLKQFMASRTTE